VVTVYDLCVENGLVLVDEIQHIMNILTAIVSDDTLSEIRDQLRTLASADLWREVISEESLLAALSVCDWDIIIVDPNATELNINQISNSVHKFGSKIPIIVVSDLAGEESVVSALHAGASDFVSRSNMARLVPVVTRLLNEHEGGILSEPGSPLGFESRGHSKQLFEHAFSGDFIASRDGTVFECNQAFARIFGFNGPRQAVEAELSSLWSGDNGWNDFVSRLMQDNPLVGYQSEMKRRDDTEIYVTINASARRGSDDNITEIYGTILDETDRRTMEQKLERSERMASLGSLAGGVVHDFNNLLTIINGYSDVILSIVQQDEDLQHHLNEIKNAGNRAAILTRQILTFSRQQVVQPQMIDFRSTIPQIGDMLKRLIGDNIDLRIEIDDHVGRTALDPVQAEQIIMNLVINARDAMPSGGTISILGRDKEIGNEDVAQSHPLPAGRYVELVITDTGTGIPAAILSQIFKPFYTTKNPLKGTGLGLSTVNSIVTQNHGAIRVSSTEGKGTAFSILLPISERPSPTTVPEIAPSALRENSETILLVEDDESLRALAREILVMNGYKVQEAANGSDALARIREGGRSKPDLLVTDVVMPKMGGPEVAQQMVTMQPDLKVLFISGYFDESGEQDQILGSDVNFLPKPFTPDALLAKVREALDRPTNTGKTVEARS
jgi:two-component system, cell cycle sensor histidine kinase and response regulator CckA